MANAKKCDRCGTYFDPLSLERHKKLIKFQNPVIQSSEDIQRLTRDYWIKNAPDTYVDLCPRCSEKFLLFMENCPLALDTDICEENHTLMANEPRI